MTSSEAISPDDREDPPRNALEGAPSRPRSKVLLALLVLFAGVACVSYLAFRDSGADYRGDQHPAIGRTPFFISLRAIDDDQPLSLADVTGDVTLINFWGTWCPPCREEMPRLQALADKYAKRDDFRILAISCAQGAEDDSYQLKSETRRYLADEGLNLPAYVDVNGETQAAIDLVVGLVGYPTTIVLDRDNTIRGVWSGYRRGYEQQMDALIERLLAEHTRIKMPQVTITGKEYLVPIDDEESAPPP